MTCAKSNASTAVNQPPKSGYGFLAAILDSLEDQALLHALQGHRNGRPGYPVRAMWRAYLAKLVLKIRFNNHLVERLRGSRKLREVCGFGEEVPSESTFSRFVSRLADHQDLVEQCLVNVTGELRGLVPAVKQRKGRQDQPLPPLGAVLAIDSTLFETYGNPNRRTVNDTVSDPDARWGLKNSAKAKDGKKEWGFGYKMHLVSDATHGVPLAFTVTPANESDSTQLRKVTKQDLRQLPMDGNGGIPGGPGLRLSDQSSIPGWPGHHPHHSHTEAHGGRRPVRRHLLGVGETCLCWRAGNGLHSDRSRDRRPHLPVPA